MRHIYLLQVEQLSCRVIRLHRLHALQPSLATLGAPRIQLLLWTRNIGARLTRAPVTMLSFASISLGIGRLYLFNVCFYIM